jgi:hypothetical protein
MTPHDVIAEYISDYKSLSAKEKTAYQNYWRYKYGIIVTHKDTATKIINEFRRTLSYNPDFSIEQIISGSPSTKVKTHFRDKEHMEEHTLAKIQTNPEIKEAMLLAFENNRL